MSDLGIFSELLEDVYDAALDPGRWSDFLNKLRTVFNGGPAALFVQDMRSDEVGMLVVEGQDPAWSESYRDHYARLNLWLRASFRYPAGSVTPCEQYVDNETLERSEFYNDWLMPQDLYFGFGGVLIRTSDVQSQWTVLRPKAAGPFRPEELRLIERLSPHVQRAIAIHGRLHTITGQREVALQAVERLRIGLLLLDRADRILYANQAGQSMLEARDAIFSAAGRLRAVGVKSMAALSGLLRIAATPGRPDDTVPGGAMALSARDGRSLSLLVCPSGGCTPSSTCSNPPSWCSSANRGREIGSSRPASPRCTACRRPRRN